jgi:glycosyltransferase involved in cell wall biosynthesis
MRLLTSFMPHCVLMRQSDDSIMTLPKVTVCMPVFRGGKFLAEAIESVLAQNFRDFEFLIIDDCSGDGTDKIVRGYASTDSRVIFKVNDFNLGMVPNWNHCLEMARGQYVKFIFQDDIFTSPESLGKMVRILDDDPAVSLVASCRQLINRHSEVVKEESFCRSSVSANGFDIIRYCLLKYGNVIGEPSAVLFRKEQAVRGFNPNYRQIVDLEMWFYLLEQGRFCYIAEPLCGFRIHSAQQSRENIRNLVHLDDFNLLYSEYFPKQYLHISYPAREHIRFHQYYNLWKHVRGKRYNRNLYNRNLALGKISRYYGSAGFCIRLFVYKLYNPVFKIFRARFRRRILRENC